MEISTTTTFGTEQRITVYDTPLAQGEAEPTITRGNEDIDADAQKYKDIIFIPNWREVLLVVDADAQMDPHNLSLRTTTSFHVQAVRQGHLHDVKPLSMVCVLRTSDEKIVLGVRGGRMAGGFVHITPAGYLPAKHAHDPMFGCFLEELHEEIGLAASDVTDCKLIGHETDPTSKGYDFILTAKTSVPSAAIAQAHTEAYNAYKAALESGSPELEARKAIVAAGLANIDAWEHVALVFVDDNQHALQQIIDAYEVQKDGQGIKILDACRGALIAYVAHKWGQ